MVSAHLFPEASPQVFGPQTVKPKGTDGRPGCLLMTLGERAKFETVFIEGHTTFAAERGGGVR